MGQKPAGSKGEFLFQVFRTNRWKSFPGGIRSSALPTRHLIVKTLSVSMAVAAWPMFQAAAEFTEIPRGEDLELHACDLSTGGGTASAQITLGGRSLVRVGNFEAGHLAGLTVVVPEVADENLSDCVTWLDASVRRGILIP